VKKPGDLTPRQYSLFLTRSQKLLVGLPLVVFAAAPIIASFVYSSLDFPGSQFQPPPFFPLFPLAIFLVVAVFVCWSIASTPYRITATTGQAVEFKSLLGVRTVRVSEMRSIEPHALRVQANISGYALRHGNGKIVFPGQFTGLHVLLSELKSANPALEIRGC